jgi:hypothetical protein
MPPSQLTQIFEIYFEEMQRCADAGAYWSLLHVVVCLPDICGAVQSPDGEAKGWKYEDWCDQWLGSALSGKDRYAMRCRLLHQGRAASAKPPNYAGFSFEPPSTDGTNFHLTTDSNNRLRVDVRLFSDQIITAVKRWINYIDNYPTSAHAKNVGRYLPDLVKVTPVAPLSQPA